MKTFKSRSLKSLYGFGGRCLNIRDFCMDFEPNFKVHNLVSVCPKSIILGQMTNLSMTFYVVGSVYRLVKIWNSPQFPAEFRNGLMRHRLRHTCVHCCEDFRGCRVGEMASEIPEIVYTFGPQLKAFMGLYGSLNSAYFAVSCSSLFEDSAESRYVPLYWYRWPSWVPLLFFTRTSHYSNLNFTYEEDYNSFSTTQKKNSWLCLDIAAFRPDNWQ